MNWRFWRRQRAKGGAVRPVTFERFDPPRDLVHVPEPITFRTVFDDDWTSCARPQCHHQFEEMDPGRLVCKECGEEREAPEPPYDWQVDGL